MRLVYPAADIVPQAHVHGVLVAAALHDVEGRDRQDAGEDAGQRLLERGVAVRRPEDDGPAGRATIEVADVADVLTARPEGFDLVSLDTDNGPDWLCARPTPASIPTVSYTHLR